MSMGIPNCPIKILIYKSDTQKATKNTLINLKFSASSLNTVKKSKEPRLKKIQPQKNKILELFPLMINHRKSLDLPENKKISTKNSPVRIK